jgi:hypothetical protein
LVLFLGKSVENSLQYCKKENHNISGCECAEEFDILVNKMKNTTLTFSPHKACVAISF